MNVAVSKVSTVRAVRDVLSCDLGDEAVILHPGSGTYYGLNPVGAAVWSLIQQPRSVPELLDHLLQEFDVEAGQCERDLLRVLQDMASAGLIEVVDGEAG